MPHLTKNKIIKYIHAKGEATPKELVLYLKITQVAVFRHLKDLVHSGKLKKIGTSPRVYYIINKHEHDIPEAAVQELEKQMQGFDKDYLYISPDGQLYNGAAGFFLWCQERQFEHKQKAIEYVQIMKKYQGFRKNGLIDGIKKIQQTFLDQVYLDQCYYLDFYSIERFGKTKLGSLLLYGKQNQDLNLIDQVYQITKDRIIKFIQEEQIDAVAFIPPTLERRIQFQKEFERLLNISLPKIKLVKIQNDVAISQKSLNKIEDRIKNARNTIFVEEEKAYKKILLIDDAIGSGATLNETARKIKQKELCQGKIIGMALTGSIKGFEVISEV